MILRYKYGIVALILVLMAVIYLFNVHIFLIEPDAINDEVNYRIIYPWSDESPIKTTFTKTKLIWRMDDYKAGFSKYHPNNIGFHLYAENITKHGGNVLISVIPNPWNTHNSLEFYEYSNKDFVAENLELYNMGGVDFAIHGWNHDCDSKPWMSDYSDQYNRFNISRETLEYNFQIKLQWFCTPCASFDLNTTKILEEENYYNTNFIKNGCCPFLELDNTFYIDNNTFHDPETLEQSKNRWNTTKSGTDNITQILFHPNRLTDKNIRDFSEFCDWLYFNNEVWNMDWGEALLFKQNKDRLILYRFDSSEFIIDLEHTTGEVPIIWSASGAWIISDVKSEKITNSFVDFEGNDILYLDSGTSYKFKRTD